MNPAEIPSIKDIRSDLRVLGYRPSRRLGQCFLTDKNLINIIAEAAGADRRTLVFEVGTGAGSLTQALAETAGRVISIEFDSLLHDYAHGRLRPVENITLIEGDALQGKSSLNPEFVTTVEEAWNTGEFDRLVFVSNLPYSIATPLVAELLLARTRDDDPEADEPRLPATVGRMVIMVQQEVADRLLASPGSKDFGYISVLVQSMCRATQLRKLGPQVFWPRPKVHSAIVELDSLEMQRAEVAAIRELMPTVRVLFRQRRKMLRNILRKMIGLDDAEVERLGERFDLHRRVDKLPPQEILHLAESVVSS